jgi:hypothetical protein
VEVLPFQVKITLESLETVSISSNVSYKFSKFDFVVGQTLSEVNKRLNPLFFAAEPYFENISEE